MAGLQNYSVTRGSVTDNNVTQYILSGKVTETDYSQTPPVDNVVADFTGENAKFVYFETGLSPSDQDAFFDEIADRILKKYAGVD